MNVLLIEYDESLASELARGLSIFGMRVDWVRTGQGALAEVRGLGEHDLVLLGLGLPDMDGMDVCQEVRRRSDVPIIIVAAQSAEVDVVVGLEMGADDYVGRPFGLRELVARIRAATRRYRRYRLLEMPDAGQVVGRVMVDRRSRRVVVAGEPVPLTPKEFDLLVLLADDVGAVVSRERIMDTVWDEHWYGSTKTLDVHIGSLRRKLGEAVRIDTVRRVGYRLEDVAGPQPVSRDPQAASSWP